MPSSGLKWFFFLLLINFSNILYAQNQRFTLSGTIKDAKTGETLIGAIVRAKEIGAIATQSNQYGFYSLTLPQGNYMIWVKMLGYKLDSIPIHLLHDEVLDIEVEENSNELSEIVVSSKSRTGNTIQAASSVHCLDMKEIANLPVLFGERDVLKTIQLLPGIKGAGEGGAGFNVRGGSADQNLILLDEAPVYNASHVLGFFSTFNSDAVKDITIYKGNSPAQYGGRLASVLDVKTNDGNSKEYHLGGGLGLISSRLMLEVPLQRERSSLLITARRTYLDLFLKQSENYRNYDLYFYDLNIKTNYSINNKHKLFLSGYMGRDKLALGEKFGINWGNKTGTLRWNWIINPKLFVNTSLIFTDYHSSIQASGSSSTFVLNSSITDWNIKQEYQYFEGNNSFRFGFNTLLHQIFPNKVDGKGISSPDTKFNHRSIENAFFISNATALMKNINIDYGFRVSANSILGGGTYPIYQDGIKIDSIALKENEFGRSYIHFEPRLSINVLLNDKNSLKMAYSLNTQNVHLLSNSSSTSPTDQWIGNSYNIQPEIANQVSIGYFHYFVDDAYELNAEIYYKDMQNQIDYKNGANIELAADVESELLFGKGRAYGLECLIKKKTGRFTGWISYTLSRTERRIVGINHNNWYAAKQDRTHDIAVVGTYQLASNWTVSATWVYYTGNAVTFPSGKYSIADKTVFLYTERNGYRMPAYHRLDLSLNWERHRTGKYQSSWNFGLYNAYGRRNAYMINFEDDPNDPLQTRAVQTTLFRWIPSITYNFRF